MKKKYKNCLVIGSNQISKEFINHRIDSKDSCDVILLDDEFKFESKNNIYFHFGLGLVKDILDTKKVESIFYCFESFNKEELLLITKICKENKLKLYLASRKESIAEKIFLDLKNIDQLFLKKTKIYIILKRIIDILVSLIVIIVLFPIFCIIAVLIPLESGFPILFKQNRVGYQQNIFQMYKFRSLYNTGNKYEESPSHANDTRITKIGKYIRKLSMDELPQFFNVLIGDMSVVGPRPEMEFIVSEYNSFEQFRLISKPGITGPWQLSSTRNFPIHFNIDYDLEYISNRSLISDFLFMIKTVLFAFRGI